MIADAELLGRYAEKQDEAAFAELVQRHLNLVYSAALRQVHGDAHLAQDVTQLVFSDLARKADRLRHHAVLTGWLYTGTRYAALQAVRTARRRQQREQEAHHMHDVSSPTVTSTEWQRLQPILDEVMHDLSERDREAVLLRFFESRPFADIGTHLGLSEDAARKRVHRALDALRAALSRHGVTSTGTALGFVIAERAVAAAPSGLGLSVAHTAVSGAGVAAVGAGAGVFSLWQMLAGTKLLAAGSAVLVVGGTLAAVSQHRGNEQVRAEIAALEELNEPLAAALAPEAKPAGIRNLEAQIAAARAASTAAPLRPVGAVAGRVQATPAQPRGAAPGEDRLRLMRRTSLDRGYYYYVKS